MAWYQIDDGGVFYMKGVGSAKCGKSGHRLCGSRGMGGAAESQLHSGGCRGGGVGLTSVSFIDETLHIDSPDI